MTCQILAQLEEVIRQRIKEGNPQSYTYRLYTAGTPHIARKVAEEAVEAAIAAIAEGRQRTVEERPTSSTTYSSSSPPKASP